MPPEARKLRIEVPGQPVTRPKLRAVMVRGSARVAGAKKDHAIHTFKAMLKLAASQEHKGPLLEGPLSVSVLCYFERPVSMVWKTKPMPRVEHTKAPDTDNICKSIFDSLTGVVWRDDRQVSELLVRKFICAGGESPRCVVEIEYGNTPAP